MLGQISGCFVLSVCFRTLAFLSLIPLCGSEQRADLLHYAQAVRLAPSLNAFAICKTPDRNAGECDRLSRDRHAHKIALLCVMPDKAIHNLVPSGKDILLFDFGIGEGRAYWPKELDNLLAWVACIADAQPLSCYAGFLTSAGFQINCLEPHDEALAEMVKQMRMKLLGAENMVGLKSMELPGVLAMRLWREAKAEA